MKKAVVLAAGILLLGAGFLLRERIIVTYYVYRVCYDPGLNNCTPSDQVPEDSTYDQKHVLNAEARVFLGFPVIWRLWVNWVGSDFLAPVELHRFHPFHKRDSSDVYGSIRASVGRQGAEYFIETELDSIGKTVWLGLERAR